jgi:hypothetical protein
MNVIAGISVVLALAGLGYLLIRVAITEARSPGAQAARARKRQAERQYCTKHVLQSFAGGPERLSWVYGQHRTRGNQCDGPEHRRQGTGSVIGGLL